MNMPYAKISGVTLEFLAPTGWISDTEYRWVDNPKLPEPIETIKTIEELNEMGYWPIEIAMDPPDTVNQYWPIYSVVDGVWKLSQWKLLKPVLDVQTIIAASFVQLAQSGNLDDAIIAENPQLFIFWPENAGFTCKAGTIVQDRVDGRIYLYQAMTNVDAGQSHHKPSSAPSLWKRISDPTEEFSEWFQPIGAHDAYSLDDKVLHNGLKWVSLYDSNIWEPGVFGWKEATE